MKCKREKLCLYQKILKNNREMDYYTPAIKLLKQSSTEKRILYNTTVCVTAPVLTAFVCWVLNDAHRKGIRKLYFLARDGYIMYLLARKFCQAYYLNIDCRYIYCSRKSLRLPLMAFNVQEALDKLCVGGYAVTADIVLERAGLTAEERMQILQEIAANTKVLTEEGLIELKEQLKNCKSFLTLASKYAKDSYKNISMYLSQEGMTGEDTFAIVDTGWTGSMQRTLRMLIESITHDNCHMQGYYFGLFQKGKVEDGDYYSFYFSVKNNYFYSICFNNNLFECLCAAPHGMTNAYEVNSSGRAVPIFSKSPINWGIDFQIETILKYADCFVFCNAALIEQKRNKKMVHNLLNSFMENPSDEEAEFYGAIPFSDDPTERYVFCLAEHVPREDIIQQTIFLKVFRKLFRHQSIKNYRESFWIEGSLAKYSYAHTNFLKLEILVTKTIKCVINYIKKG